MRGRARLMGVLAVVMALLMVTTPAVAQSGQGLDLDDSKTPDPVIDVTYEKASHNMSHSTNVLDYQNDSNGWQTLPGELADLSNPITLNPAEIDVGGSWPASSNSTLSPDQWAKSGNTSNLNVTERSDDADGLTFDTTGMASGDSVTATFSNVSVTTDAGKHVLWTAVDITELNGTATLVVSDSDGDEKRFHVNASASASANDVLATQTGPIVLQEKFGNVVTEGSGDGTFDAIESISFTVQDGNVDASFTKLSAAKMTAVSYGSQQLDTDGDNETETVDITEPTGTYNVSSLDTLGSAFDAAQLYNVQFEYVQHGSNIEYEFSEDAAEDYQYKYAFGGYYSFELPNVMDLSIVQADLTTTVTYPTNRLLDAKYIEGAGGSSYDDLADSSAWQDLTTAFEDAGDNGSVTLDASIQEGVRYVGYFQWLTSGDDKTAMTESGGAGVPLGGTGQGIIDAITSLPGILISGVVGYVGIFRGGFMRLLGWIRSFFG